jgi:hypothetical protein
VTDDYEARLEARRADDSARREAWGDGVYDAWKGYAPDPDFLGRGYPEDYYRGYEEMQ